jgi:hypothetical protein
VFWFDAAGRRHPTNAIHLYPNQTVVQVRLDDPSAMFQGIERGVGPTGAPWAGQVTSFRINPNDTKGSRCFTIGRVWLTSDDPAGTVVDLPANARLSPQAVSSSRVPRSTGSKVSAARTQKSVRTPTPRGRSKKAKPRKRAKPVKATSSKDSKMRTRQSSK